MMKKIMLFAAACIALVACTKNIDNATPTGRQVTISATFQIPSEYATKVSPDASSLSASTITFHWEAGDKVVLSSNDYTEMQLFTIVDASINGTTANFTGTALTDMTDYEVTYYGKNTSIEFFMSDDPDSISYEANNFHPYATGSGSTDGFTMDNFMPVINIPLKGNATIGKIDFYQKMNGQFILATNMSFETGLSLSDAATPVYMPLVYYSTSGFRIKIYDTDNQLLLEKTSSFNLMANEGFLVTFPALEVKAIPEGALSGVFSVSATTKVRFSKGNLYFDGSAFKFEDNQYSSASSWNTSHVSHFYWSKTASVAYASSYSDASAAPDDVFFTNATATTPKADFTANGQTGIWRTLSGGNSGEWEYLLSTRTVNGGTGEGKSYQRATVNSVYGLIIYPDNYTGQTTSTSYSSAEWTTMEKAGCVFLTAAGSRQVSTFFSKGQEGDYWSSSLYDQSYANSPVFSKYFVSFACSQKSSGCSVRLVTDAN